MALKPAPPPKDALAYFRAKGWKLGWDWRDVWKEEHATAFTVAKAMELDLLQDIRAALDLALEQGVTFKGFQKTLRPLLASHGWWGKQIQTDPLTGEEKLVELGSPRRLKIIYQTNLRTARAAGQWARIQSVKDTLPYLLYMVGPSREHRPEHLAWHGLLLPVDDDFWQTRYPPSAWGCKCRVRQITHREYDRLRREGVQAPASAETQILVDGLPTGRHKDIRVPVQTTAPPLDPQPWINKRTGKTEMVPKGVDPGWGFNPGAVSRRAQALDLLRQKLPPLPPPLAVAAVTDLLNSEAFLAWFDKPSGNFPVGVLDDALAERLQTPGRVIDLSPETMGKQKRADKHQELSAAEYQVLPALFADGRVITQGEFKLVFYRVQGRLYKAVVKVTADRQDPYLVSFYRTDEREMARDLRRGQLVRDWR